MARIEVFDRAIDIDASRQLEIRIQKQIELSAVKAQNALTKFFVQDNGRDPEHFTAHWDDALLAIYATTSDDCTRFLKANNVNDAQPTDFTKKYYAYRL